MTGQPATTYRRGMGWTEITTPEELVEVLGGEPLPYVRDKARSALHALDRAWLAAAPTAIATSSATRTSG